MFNVTADSPEFIKRKEPRLEDFNQWESNEFRTYGGSNGFKRCMSYQEQPYMVKLISKKDAHPYSHYSEYIGCHIFEALGVPAQRTILGKYQEKGILYDAIACRDFNVDGNRLLEFLTVKNSCIDSSREGKGTQLNAILDAIDEQNKIPGEDLKKYFWDMFIVDAWIGNFDRHTGNWGILANENAQSFSLAPIYDCGSCLYPNADDATIQKILNSEAEQNQRIFEFPTSAIKDSDGRKINYFDFIVSNQNIDCTMALQRITPKIDMEKIKEIIQNVPELSELRKAFYLKMLSVRKERILDYCYEKLKNVSCEHEETIHHVSDAIKNSKTEYSRSDQLYMELYLQRQKESMRAGKKLLNSNTDVDIAVELMDKYHEDKKAVRRAILLLSPKADGSAVYADEIMVKARNIINARQNTGRAR